MDGIMTPSKFDFQYAESTIIFRICDCSLDKKYSFYDISREQAERFIKRLQHIEKLTWKQFMALDREHGVTVEIKGSESFEMIDGQNTSANKLLERYYYHFRVEQKGVFRIFGYQDKQFFHITHIDSAGKIHH
ncbi:MAG: hypothetical protein NTZ38_01385 [Candidatus Taylorbacteria bacterium]|nr:hypothetical protein [Candidatus Taylorbacteria bacterium]